MLTKKPALVIPTHVLFALWRCQLCSPPQSKHALVLENNRLYPARTFTLAVVVQICRVVRIEPPA